MEGCFDRAALPLCAILAQEQLCHLLHQKVFGLYISHMTRKVGGVGVDPSPPVVIAGLCHPSIPQAPTVTTATLCRRCIGTSVMLHHTEGKSTAVLLPHAFLIYLVEFIKVNLRGTFTQISSNII